jgi:hypothetical protein
MDSSSSDSRLPVHAERNDLGADEARGRTRLHTAAVWLFYALLAIPLIHLLYASTDGGFGLITIAIDLVWLGILVVGWLVLLIVRLKRGQRRFGSIALAVAPAIVILAFALVLLGVPARARWDLSRSAFDAVAAQASSDPHMRAVPTPTEFRDARYHRVGLYTVSQPYGVAGGWIVYEDYSVHGGLFLDDVGFAYLPGGPTPALDGAIGGDGLRFDHLGGPWYRWYTTW